MIKRIHVIVNPAAGQEKPILATLNKVFHPAGVDWEVKVTKKEGDARRYAQEAVVAGVDAVASCGGDGTVMEVASGLVGSEVPMAILPGGTANVMSVELGIPFDFALATALICSDQQEIKKIDMGRIDDQYFLLRAGTGFEAALVQGAPRESKDRLGNLAYILSALQALANPKVAHYTLTLDGKQIQVEGITCMVANSGNIGQPGLTLASNIDVSDGLLDVLVIRSGDLGSILSVVASMVTKNEQVAQPLQHYQAQQIRIETDPVQDVQADGEILGNTPVEIKVLPHAVRVIVPKPAQQAEGAG
jgi:diacylglycerol kinase (ATP)